MLKLNLKFNEEQHRYYDGKTGKDLISATTLIGKYKDSFNTHYWSMYTGLKNSHFKVLHYKNEKYIKVNDIKCHIDNLYKNEVYKDLALHTQKDWKEKTEKSHIRGNATHDYLEGEINKSREDEKAKDNKLIQPLSNNYDIVKISNINDLNKTNLYDTYPVIYYKLKEYISFGCIIFAEKKIYNSKYFVAGMIDVLVVHPKTKKFAIVDWKTNKDKIHFVSGYYKKQKINGEWVKTNNFIPTNDYLKSPLNNLYNCKGIVYSLQLSLYAFLMEQWGYKLVNKGLTIYHFRLERKPICLNIKYYKNDIYNMLEDYYRKSNKITIEKEKRKRNKLKNNNLNFGIK